jgi:uncharacterized metal-binding protein YceD (DUF177 family)
MFRVSKISTKIEGIRYLVFIKLIFNFADFLRGNVNHPDQYQIAFTGLNPGTHIFDFKIGDTFFEQVKDAEITGGKVLVVVTMAREERMMDLHLAIEGKVRVTCDRCNEQMDQEIKGNERLIIKLGDHYYEESEDVQVIPDTAHQFDLAPFIYEYIHLLLPIRRVHPEDKEGNSQCDPEIIKKLQELRESHIPDPRWEALAQLKKNRKS